MPDIPTNSIGFSVYSPPFADLYSYSDADADMGNCRDYGEFFTHFDFLIKEHERTMKPGRIVAVHCMDLPTQIGKEGYSGLTDFPGDLVKAFKKHGFIFASRHVIWKDPLLSAVRTHALGLAHKQIVKDSSQCRMGIADMILAFRKPGDNPEPIMHPEGLTTYAGDRSIPHNLERFNGWTDQRTNKRSHWIWQQYASPVWDDIRQTRVLPYRKAREEDDQKHICPLQLDVIERCLTLWSNPGDIVLTPFGGVGSEAYVAVEMKRKAILIELKKSYWRQAVRNLESLRTKQKQRTFASL
jgi:DNA modification methylase